MTDHNHHHRQFIIIIHLLVVLLLLIEQTDAVAESTNNNNNNYSCGIDAIPYQMRIEIDGMPHLSCATPSCFGGDTGDIRSLDEAEINYDEYGDFERWQNGRFRDRNAPKQSATCTNTFDRNSCSDRLQWIGGIRVPQDPEKPLLLDCCKYDGLRYATEYGSVLLQSGEAYAGGEVFDDDQRQYAFDLIKEVKRSVNADDKSVEYQLTIYRMPCLPEPIEPRNKIAINEVHDIARINTLYTGHREVVRHGPEKPIRRRAPEKVASDSEQQQQIRPPPRRPRYRGAGARVNEYVDDGGGEAVDDYYPEDEYDDGDEEEDDDYYRVAPRRGGGVRSRRPPYHQRRSRLYYDKRGRAYGQRHYGRGQRRGNSYRVRTRRPYYGDRQLAVEGNLIEDNTLWPVGEQQPRSSLQTENIPPAIEQQQQAPPVDYPDDTIYVNQVQAAYPAQPPPPTFQAPPQQQQQPSYEVAPPQQQQPNYVVRPPPPPSPPQIDYQLPSASVAAIQPPPAACVPPCVQAPNPPCCDPNAAYAAAQQDAAAQQIAVQQQQQQAALAQQQAALAQQEAAVGIDPAASAAGAASAADIFSQLQCFAGDTLVRTVDGVKSMAQLQVGELVLSTQESLLAYSPVIMFMHRQVDQLADFYQLRTVDGHTLKLTEYHLIYVGKCGNNRERRMRQMYARDVRVGDCLYAIDWDRRLVLNAVEIVNISMITDRGIYAPLTATGDIVVNGVLASCHSSVHGQTLQQTFFTWMQYFNNALIDVVGGDYDGWLFDEAGGNLPASVNYVISIFDMLVPASVFVM